MKRAPVRQLSSDGRVRPRRGNLHVPPKEPAEWTPTQVEERQSHLNRPQSMHAIVCPVCERSFLTYVKRPTRCCSHRCAARYRFPEKK